MKEALSILVLLGLVFTVVFINLIYLANNRYKNYKETCNNVDGVLIIADKYYCVKKDALIYTND